MLNTNDEFYIVYMELWCSIVSNSITEVFYHGCSGILDHLIILFFSERDKNKETRALDYPNKDREVFPGESARPTIEDAVDVLPVLQPHHLVNDLGELPVPLPAVPLDAEPVSGGDPVLPRPADLGGDAALAFVVVHEADRPLLVPRGHILPALPLGRGSAGLYPYCARRRRGLGNGRRGGGGGRVWRNEGSPAATHWNPASGYGSDDDQKRLYPCE